MDEGLCSYQDTGMGKKKVEEKNKYGRGRRKKIKEVKEWKDETWDAVAEPEETKQDLMVLNRARWLTGIYNRCKS